MSPYSCNISFSQRLFLSVMSLFLLFVICFVAYQYHREKAYKIELLNTKLQDYNRQMEESFSDYDELNDSLIESFLHHHYIKDLRVTLIREDGKVVFDSEDKDYDHIQNHKNRMEVRTALKNGSGYDIIRTSETLQGNYFYSATYFEKWGYVVRTALPYNVTLANSLAADMSYIWFTLGLTFILTFIYYRYTRKLGMNITQLRRFAKRAERNEDLENVQIPFPNNELGEISHHIVRLYAQLKKSEEDKTRLKRQLTQNIAHELKTPVSSIQGYLETIVNNPDMAKEKQQQFLERCYAQSNRLTNLLCDISVLTRMDEASQSFDMEEVNISQLLHNIRKDVTLQLAEKNITFLILMEANVVVPGSSLLLYSIFRNLTDNAIAYAGQGITITVKCIKEDNRFYYFSFADNGIGVAPEHLDHLFERFYRIDKGRSRKLGGTGLGLAIVKNAVFLHGGTISARIASTGGLEFLFNLAKEQN